MVVSLEVLDSGPQPQVHNSDVLMLSDHEDDEVEQFYQYNPDAGPHVERCFVDALPCEVL